VADGLLHVIKVGGRRVLDILALPERKGIDQADLKISASLICKAIYLRIKGE
jgi:hypothetical protein